MLRRPFPTAEALRDTVGAEHYVSSLLASCHKVSCRLPALEWLNAEGRWTGFAGGTLQRGKDTDAPLPPCFCSACQSSHPRSPNIQADEKGPKGTVIREARL